MSSTSRQDGKVDTTFIKGLDLILESLIAKNDIHTVEARGAADDDIELAEVDGVAKAIAVGSGPTRCVRKDAHSHDDDEDGNAYIHDDDDQENDALATSTDLGDKTNLPPEMGRKDEGAEGLIGDGSIAEPNPFLFFGRGPDPDRFPPEKSPIPLGGYSNIWSFI